MTDKKGQGIDTLLAHTGSEPGRYRGAVNVPPHRMSTVVFPNYETFENHGPGSFVYGRAGTPSSAAFEEAIAQFEGAEGCVSTCSGLAAIVTTLVAFASAGDHVLMTDNCYGPSRKSCEDILRRFGVDVEYYPPMIGAEIATLFRPNTKLVFMEAPGSLTFEVQDVGAIVDAAKKAGIKTAIDNSWATPLFFRPMEQGIDVSVMTATKYIGGHSDILLGAVSANAGAFAAVKAAALRLGYCAGSEELYLGLRGLRTLGARMKQHEKNAFYLATWLSGHPAVKRVLHPALPSCPGHDNWQKYYKGSSGTFGIILHETGRDKIAAMLDGMQVFSLGFSWGGFESLLFPEQPKSIRTAQPWTEEGFSLRIHVGLEDIEDLKNDLDAGLSRLAG